MYLVLATMLLLNWPLFFSDRDFHASVVMNRLLIYESYFGN